MCGGVSGSPCSRRWLLTLCWCVSVVSVALSGGASLPNFHRPPRLPLRCLRVVPAVHLLVSVRVEVEEVIE